MRLLGAIIRPTVSKHILVMFAVLLSFTAFLTASSAAPAAALPYAASSVISGVTYDWNSHLRRAVGSDNWPVTWADDGHQYTAFGDGGGFGGANNDGRVSLGFGRVEGNFDNYQGFNVWGGKNPESPAQFDGKSYGIISIAGVLYSWWGPGSNTTSYSQTRLLVSTNKGQTWSKSSWDLTSTDGSLIMPTILNFGRDYAGARDSYVYHYFIRKQGNPSSLNVQVPGIIDLARTPQNQLLDRSAYEFYTGTDSNGSPTWSPDAANRQPVFQDPNGVGWNLAVSYNPGLGRYLLTTEHSGSFDGNLGIFDAPEPWGPWTTVDYSANWGDNVGGGVFYWNFANKWLSANGQDFTLVFSGIGANDSWNTVRGQFTTTGSVDTTPPTAPTGLSTASVSESEVSLSWTAASDPESGVGSYNIYRNGSPVGAAAGASFSDTGLNEGTSYTYAVSAINGVGLEGPVSQPATGTTLADTIPPTIAGVSAGSPTLLTLLYSEAMDQISVTNPANYSIDLGTTVSAATLDSDLRTVTLTTSNHSAGVSYTLTVNNVTDRATTPNPIASNTQVSYLANDPSLVAHWTFDEGSGSTVLDSSGNGSNGTLQNLDLVSSWIPGQFSTALQFDGVNDYVAFGNPVALQIGANITVSAWIKPEATPTGQNARVISKDNGSTGDNWTLAIGDNFAVDCRIGNTLNESPGGVIATSVWQHVACTYDGATVRVYVAGVEKHSYSHSGGIPTSGNVVIGRNDGSPSRFFSGGIDDVRVYNRALSNTQVASLASGTGPPRWNGDVTFSATLQGRGISGPSWSMPFGVSFYTPASGGTSTLISSFLLSTTPTTSQSGSFTANVTPGTYDIWVKGETTLAGLLRDVDLNVEPSAPISLGAQAGGDATKDNLVDSLDFDELLAVFGRPTSSLTPQERLSDHNRDGVVDIVDFAIVVENSGASGEPLP